MGMLNEALKQVCVIGAGGKMGSGIALLLLQEMAKQELEATGQLGGDEYRLMLIDTNESSLGPLVQYLREHLTRYAEKNIIHLRKQTADHPKLVSNEDTILFFVEGALNNIRCGNHLELAKSAKLIFEAIVEDIEIKSQVLQKVSEITQEQPYFFSNTSSIPIHVLNKLGHLHDRLVGFHFYNPPAVQKLLELIVPKGAPKQLSDLSEELARRLQKTVVHSNDIAGFIGNGYMIREIIFACEKVQELSIVHPLPESIFMVNKVTQDFLVRPMGIFQLMDYVGIDVCYRICDIMNTYLPQELFQNALLDQMVKEEILGGQYPDGSQKDGFFQYEGSARIGIYSLVDHQYIPFSDSWKTYCDHELGPFPKGHLFWKNLQKDHSPQDKLQAYFHNLLNDKTLGSDIARAFLNKSKAIAQLLVETGVAPSIEDVDTVLKNGFFHLYGIDVSWQKMELNFKE
jgi:3-hydroxyacyl-CoA dehydrogenase